jgi:aminodeoxyfutalosine deaminase
MSDPTDQRGQGPGPGPSPLPAPLAPGDLVRLDAHAALDARSAIAGGVSLLLEVAPADSPWPGRVLALGPAREVDLHEAARSPRLRARLRRPHAVLLPGMVNAHTHLDLTHLGPIPHDPGDDGGGFVGWVDMIRRGRHADPADIAASVQLGIELSRRAGVVAVGDIAGAPRGRMDLTPFDTLAQSGLLGVSYAEFFGIGTSEAARGEELVAFVEAHAGSISPAGGVRLGLQPHAPNTVSLANYALSVDLARRFGLPLATHLAESPEERRFIQRGEGPQRELLERLGVWDDALLAVIGRGRTPVEHLADILARARFTVAHVNDCPDEAVRTLANAGACVAYCPRASAYFHAERHFGPHRYRDLLAAGVTVALGTDSIVNLPADARVRGLSVLDEARFLHWRDGTDPGMLLEMITVNGARAIGMEPSAFTLSGEGPIGGVAGVVAVELDRRGLSAPTVAEQVMASDTDVEILFGRKSCGHTGIPANERP